MEPSAQNEETEQLAQESEQQLQPQSHQPPEPQLEIEVDDPENSDYDSTYDADGAVGSMTTSLKSSNLEYRQQHGRTFHSFREGQYNFPIDDDELDRLDLQHHLFKVALKNKLFLAPISESVQNVLDIGTGTGIWAMEFADTYPSASVIGTDLSPTQPTWVPPNVQFEVDDANDTWTFSQKFDYIHGRYLHMAIEEKRLFRQAYDALQPGGWFEIMETPLPLQADDNSLEGTALLAWCEEMLKLGHKIGCNFQNPWNYKQWVEEAGFINVQEHRVILPINPWPRDSGLKKTGAWQQISFTEGVEAFSVKLWMDFLGWSRSDYELFLFQVRKDIENRNVHAYFVSFIVCGQKPMQ